MGVKTQVSIESAAGDTRGLTALFYLVMNHCTSKVLSGTAVLDFSEDELNQVPNCV